MADFRILTLDGGGSWALIEIMALIKYFDPLGGANLSGHDVLRRFDLVAANSGGSLVLGGLAVNMKLGDMLDLFADPQKNKRDLIFAPLAPLSDVTDWFFRQFGIGAKYDTQKKLEGLRAIVGPAGTGTMTTLPGVIGTGVRNRQPQLVICSFDYDSNRARFFRSDAQSLSANFGQHANPQLVEAVHASANPPVNYFNNPASFGGFRYWDGGIGGYNNPCLAAAIEAVANAGRYQTSIPEIKILSLGTGSIVLPDVPASAADSPVLVVNRETRSLKGDLRKLAECILDDPPDAASFHTHMLLGGRMPTNNADVVSDGPIVRMSPLVQPVFDSAAQRWRFPSGLDEPTVAALKIIDADAVTQTDVDRVKVFAQDTG
jgi:patatin-like phospholipase